MSKVRKLVLALLGTVSLALGVVGAFLPVLPSTPFILLSILCYVRSSERMCAWVMNSRFAGKHVHNVLEGHGIPLSVKIFSVTMSFCMIGYVSIFQTESFVIRLLLGLLFVVQIYFMVRIKTLKRSRPSRDSRILNLQSPNDVPDLR